MGHFIFNSRFKRHLNNFRDQWEFENITANLKIIQSAILKVQYFKYVQIYLLSC